MSRPASSAQRSLSLTEELEKLEQSITLTLQEIDHNFSKAHRIVTTSILPLVEQYGEHSRAVWDASKFWKQFFEASANVSLSGYEELANDDEDDTTAAEETTITDETVNTTATGVDDDSDITPRPRSPGDGEDDSTISGHHHNQRRRQQQEHSADSSLLTDDGAGDVTGSTPRPPATRSLTVPQPSSSSPPPPSRPARFAGLDSPYEALKREMMREADPHGHHGGHEDEDEDGDGDDTVDLDESASELLFRQRTARLPDMSMTPRNSLGGGTDGGAGGGGDEDLFSGRQGPPQQKDRLLHRVLDKNYRLQATPHRPMARGTSPARWRVAAGAAGDRGKGKGEEGGEAQTRRKPWEDSPMSSPEMAPPTLRSAAFMSPARAAYRGGGGQGQAQGKLGAAAEPRTPGVSVQTPATRGKTKDVFRGQQGSLAKGRKKEKDEITWESDSDEDVYAGMSPPKTIQFAMPASRLLQTPAREASKRIVEDILLTAGEVPDESSEYSPTMVKMNANILDDTF